MEMYSHSRMFVRIQAVLHCHVLETEFRKKNHKFVKFETLDIFDTCVYSWSEFPTNDKDIQLLEGY